jgi:hypothetical protein
VQSIWQNGGSFAPWGLNPEFAVSTDFFHLRLRSLRLFAFQQPIGARLNLYMISSRRFLQHLVIDNYHLVLRIVRIACWYFATVFGLGAVGGFVDGFAKIVRHRGEPLGRDLALNVYAPRSAV